LARKIEKARSLRGPRLIIALSPCPTGWDYDPSATVDVGRLAVSTGVWPLKEYENGRVVHTVMPRERPPVEEYLKRQGRFAHLFAPQRNEAVLAQIQRRVDDYWAAVQESP
jgi:pyruvate ferredoxin oxidoreductase beta subunit